MNEEQNQAAAKPSELNALLGQPNSTRSAHAALLNRLCEMQDAPYYATARATLAEAEQTIAALEKDAARYRWLRRKVGIIAKHGHADFEIVNLPKPTHIAPRPDIELDAVIDADMGGLLRPNAEFSRGAAAPSAATPGYAGTNQEEK